jgi:hypothetical protein
MGIILAILLFWVPFIMVYWFLGWLYVLLYGVLLVGSVIAAGFMSRVLE